MGDKDYTEIMKIAFQAEGAINDEIRRKFGRTYPDKTILIKEGDVDQRIFWILQGEVYITRREGNKYKVINTVGKGELIGEMSFFDKSVRSATVISKGTVEALTFSKENFQDIFAASPQWTKRLLDSLSTRIQLMIGKLNSIH
jgi:CRP/FNR family cyclic AMP-dependent transcriptional regulator